MTPALLDIARERAPHATLVSAGMDALPFAEPERNEGTALHLAMKALLGSAGGARSVRAAGEARVRAALADAIAPFRDASGAVAIRNVFRYVIAVKP